MRVVVHLLARNEAEIIGYTLKHYRSYCAEIVLHDLGSTDATMDIARSFGAVVKQHDSGGEFRDALNKKIKNECWHGTDADWVICADADEMMYFPAGAKETLKSYDEQQVAVACPYGYEMVSDVFPNGNGQITEYVKHGARDDFWYGKMVMFSPKRVAAVDFGAGAHVTHATLHGGRKVTFDARTPRNSPPLYLLHFHHLGSVEAIGAKYEAVIARLSPENRRQNQGIQSGGHQHARDKRRAIMAKLERVLA